MKIGDLVRIRPHCANKGRIAIVITGKWCNELIIQYLSAPYERNTALVSNVEIISESR